MLLKARNIFGASLSLNGKQLLSYAFRLALVVFLNDSSKERDESLLINTIVYLHM